MNFRDKIENHPVLWLLGALFTGFLSGIGTYQSIISIAKLDVIPISEVLRLRQASSKLKQPHKSVTSSNSANFSNEVSEYEKVSSSSTPKATIQDVSDVASKTFESGNPFPVGFGQIKPGDKLSFAKAIFENGEITSNILKVDIDDGLFQTVAYMFSPNEDDPTIQLIVFLFRDAEYPKAGKLAIAAAFKGFQVKSFALGSRLEWPDVKEYTVTWSSDFYKIERNERIEE